MKDWRAIAQAHGLTHEFDRITAPLDSLEKVFRPLAGNLTTADEPATTFSAEAEEGRQ